MNISDNKNFQSVKLYRKKITLEEILSINQTKHIKNQRKERFERAVALLDKNDYIENIFLVDKKHPEGKELHCMTHSGMIFILNERKYLQNIPCFITVFLARRNQILRLCKPFNIYVDEYTLKKCDYYKKNNLNV